MRRRTAVYLGLGPGVGYDVTADGQRFLVNVAAEEPEAPPPIYRDYELDSDAQVSRGRGRVRYFSRSSTSNCELEMVPVRGCDEGCSAENIAFVGIAA